MNENMTSVLRKLFAIQQKLHVPKGRKNSFGGYVFRNAADILESVKPLLAANNCVVKLDDEIENLGARFYVKSTATIIDIDTGEQIAASADARENEEKKGMDAAQVTGASSSYARKYALAGLFGIDDSRLDPDETNSSDPVEVKDGGKSTAANAAAKVAKKAGSETKAPIANQPEATAAVQGAAKKPEASAKKKAAWAAFLGLSSTRALPDTERGAAFKKVCMMVGDKPEAFGDGEWDKVAAVIGEIAKAQKAGAR